MTTQPPIQIPEPAPLADHLERLVRPADPQRPLRRHVHLLVLEGAFSGVMVNLVTGVLLIKFALELNASPFELGLLAAIPFLCQFVQVPAIMLLGVLPYRKMVTLMGGVVYRLSLLGMAALPLLGDPVRALHWLLIVVLIREIGLGWGSGPWFGWVRELVPSRLIGRAYGERLKIYTLTGTVTALAGGILLDYMEVIRPSLVDYLFAGYFLFAGVAGIFSFALLMRLPEVKLPQISPWRLLEQIYEPLTDTNFRKMLIFLTALLFAVNIAVPFFPVYMLSSLHIKASYVTALWALGQMMQVPLYNWWGWVGDKYSQTTSLATSMPFLMASMFLWPFVAMPNVHPLTGPLLIVIHLLMGVGLAGVTLATQIIAMKMAPRQKITGYAASIALVAALASGLGSIFGGWLAGSLAGTSLRLKLEWATTLVPGGDSGAVVAYTLTGYEFLFVLAGVLILLSTPLLLAVREHGSVPKEVVLRLMRQRAVSIFRGSIGGPGVRGLAYFPMVLLLRRKRQAKP